MPLFARWRGKLEPGAATVGLSAPSMLGAAAWELKAVVVRRVKQ